MQVKRPDDVAFPLAELEWGLSWCDGNGKLKVGDHAPDSSL